MLDKLKKLAGVASDSQAEASLQSLQAEFDAYRETAEALAAQYEEQLAAVNARVAEMDAMLAAHAEAEKTKAAAEAAALEQAKVAKAEARKAALAAAVGDVQGEALFASLEHLPDEQFDAVVKAMTASVDAEAAADADAVQGVEVEVVAEQDKPTHFMQFIRKG